MIPPTRCRSLNLAVTPLVRHIVLVSTQGQPLYVSRDHRQPFNPYAAYLFTLLDRPQLRYFDVQPRREGYAALTAGLPVLIPDWQVRYGAGGEITQPRELAFNTFVLKSFRQRMREEIVLRIELGQNLKAATEQTLGRWCVDEDLYPLSVAIRDYARYRSAGAPPAAG